MTATQLLFPAVQYSSDPSTMCLDAATARAQPDESLPQRMDDCRQQQLSSRKGWGISILAPGEEMPAEVVPGRIYVGNHEQAHNRSMLQTLNVTHIVNASRNQSNPFTDSIKYCTCGVADSADADISSVLEVAYRFISAALEESSQSVVLVHCSRGISRSVAIVAGYLMRTFALSFHESICRIRQSHPAAEPNYGFVAQLQEREKDWRLGTETSAGQKRGDRRSSLEQLAWDVPSWRNSKRIVLDPADV